MSLRPAQPTDALSLAALSIEVWLGTYLKEGISPQFADYVLGRFTADTMRALINDPNEQMLVSQNTQGIDGYVRLSFGRAAPVAGCSDIEISTLYVQPRHHGRGLGRALLAGAFDLCRARGGTGVWLTTNAQNSPAIAFYNAQGFVDAGTTFFELDGEAYPNIVFCKSLR